MKVSLCRAAVVVAVLLGSVACGPGSSSVLDASQAELSKTKFSLSLSPAQATADSSGSASFRVSASGSSKSQISLTVNGLPAGVTAAWSTNAIQTGGSSTLTLTADASVNPGDLAFTVVGSAGKSASVRGTLTIAGGVTGVDGGIGNVDGGTTGDVDAGTGGNGNPGAPLPTCPNRPAGRTQIDVKVRVDTYGGLQHGRNGTHEIIDGTITSIVAVATQSDVDTSNVHLALNVSSSIDPSGLPNEIVLSPGQTLEAVGEYIPASSANASNSHGAAAVIHFTHAPCGDVTINGATYH